MATFSQTLDPTPFGIFDSDVDFAADANSIVVFVKRKLGDDILSVELTNRQIWACFEEAFLEYGSHINMHQARNQLQSLLGLATGSLSGSEQLYIRDTMSFLERKAEAYSYLAGIGGPYNHILGYIDLVNGQQDYDITTQLKDASGNVIYDLQPSGSKNKLRVIEVLHFSPSAAYRFFDSTSAINYLNNEFSFESFTPETIFYVLPVFEDILRAGQFAISQRVRRSNYSYEMIGTNIRIFPTPTNRLNSRLYIKVMPTIDPTGQSDSLASGSAGLSYKDDSIYGVSNVSNVPFGNLIYARINSVGRHWVREYTLALCKELLGLVRSKFKSVPIPNSDLTLNGDDLVSQGREDREKLTVSLKEMLDSLTYDAMLAREAEKYENMSKQLRGSPIPPSWAIKTG